MDPFSIATGCTGLLAVIVQASLTVTQFVRGVREARGDIHGIIQELSSLTMVLELIKVEANGLTLDRTVEKGFENVIKNCTSVVGEVNKLVAKYDGKSRRQGISWAVHGKDDAKQLRHKLEIHKNSLDIFIDFITLVAVKNVKGHTELILSETKEVHADTKEIREDTKITREDMKYLIQQITELHDKISDLAAESQKVVEEKVKKHEAQESDYIMGKYLEDLASRTEAAVEDTEERMRELSDSLEGSSITEDIRGHYAPEYHDPKYHDPRIYPTTPVYYNGYGGLPGQASHGMSLVSQGFGAYPLPTPTYPTSYNVAPYGAPGMQHYPGLHAQYGQVPYHPSPKPSLGGPQYEYGGWARATGPRTSRYSEPPYMKPGMDPNDSRGRPLVKTKVVEYEVGGGQFLMVNETEDPDHAIPRTPTPKAQLQRWQPPLSAQPAQTAQNTGPPMPYPTIWRYCSWHPRLAGDFSEMSERPSVAELPPGLPGGVMMRPLPDRRTPPRKPSEEEWPMVVVTDLPKERCTYALPTRYEGPEFENIRYCAIMDLKDFKGWVDFKTCAYSVRQHHRDPPQETQLLFNINQEMPPIDPPKESDFPGGHRVTVQNVVNVLHHYLRDGVVSDWRQAVVTIRIYDERLVPDLMWFLVRIGAIREWADDEITVDGYKDPFEFNLPDQAIEVPPHGTPPRWNFRPRKDAYLPGGQRVAIRIYESTITRLPISTPLRRPNGETVAYYDLESPIQLVVGISEKYHLGWAWRDTYLPTLVIPVHFGEIITGDQVVNLVSRAEREMESRAEKKARGERETSLERCATDRDVDTEMFGGNWF